MPDPNLKSAMAEIQEVLRRHDCAAVVVLCSKTHSEFLMEITPSWSVAFFEPPRSAPGPARDAMAGQRLRFRSKASDFPSREAQHEATQATVGMIAGLAEAAHSVAGQLGCVLQGLSEHMQIEVRNTREGWPNPPDPAAPAAPPAEGGKSP